MRLYWNNSQYVKDYIKADKSRSINKIVKHKFFKPRFSESRYSHRQTYLRHSGLCVMFFGTCYEYKFRYFWQQVNNEGQFVASDYIDGYFHKRYRLNSQFPSALLRLLLLEEFKHWLKTGEYI